MVLEIDLGGFRGPDFMIFVWFHDKDNCDAYRMFIVPANVVDRSVFQAHELWHSHPKKDGSARKLTDHVMIRMNGKDNDTCIGNNFAEKWKQYEGNWDQLERRTEA